MSYHKVSWINQEAIDRIPRGGNTTDKQARARRRALIENKTIRRLMPRTVAIWEGSQDDVPFAELHAEDIAYGEHLLSLGDTGTTMFERRCTSAAAREQHATRTLCEAIINFDLDAFLGRLEHWQQQQ